MKVSLLLFSSFVPTFVPKEFIFLLVHHKMHIKFILHIKISLKTKWTKIIIIIKKKGNVNKSMRKLCALIKEKFVV